MKSILIALFALLTSLSLHAQTCDDTSTLGRDGVDPWPWSVAQPFPWDNISGFWKLGDDDGTYLKAVVSSKTADDIKLLKITVYRDGVCSKPFAQGKGYINMSEKNVVQTIMSDQFYSYRFKLGMFDLRDVTDNLSPRCNRRIMGASLQVIGHARNSPEKGTPLDPDVTEIENMVLRKVTVDLNTACKN